MIALNSAIDATANSNIEVYLKIAELITISGSKARAPLKVRLDRAVSVKAASVRGLRMDTTSRSVKENGPSAGVHAGAIFIRCSVRH